MKYFEVNTLTVIANESSGNIKLYTKLPSWFKIDAPLDAYNQDE
ncbi:MAG: hypothetical protein ACRC6R_04110 [Bacteroidales bacterium]